VKTLLYCSVCSGALSWVKPQGDNISRSVCTHCGEVHYQNPKIIVGCLPVWKDQVLLCRRSIEPRKGFWTLPAGFMENGETLAQGAGRETEEESCALVDVGPLFTVMSLPGHNQVHMYFYATMRSDYFGVTAESSEVRLFGEQDIPWSDLAFETIRQTLEHYFSDRQQGMLGFHVLDLERNHD